MVKITGDVELPEALVNAARDGDLVLFVGAGISVSSPSDLPTFAALAGLIAERLGRTFDGKEPADAFLGRLATEFPATKQIARDIISAKSSAPNATHTAIARLADAAKCAIVTTNYDEHITGAASNVDIDLGDVFKAPAVPLARSFTGVVHLHGAVSRRAADFVLTDDDFGRAYLTDGWARRFVQDLFTNRTVLFIGYSHSDVVVTYLARGLPPNTRRYVLTHEPEDQRWVDLRIEAIGYPSNDDHKALPAALEAWAQLHRMGSLDHAERVRELVQGAPPKTPAEADYMAYALGVPSGVHAFAGAATGEAWLRWAETQPVFEMLFDPAGELSESARVVANWFADTYVADPMQSHAAMRVFARRGPFVNPFLRHTVAISCARMKSKSPALAEQWALLVAAAMSTDRQVDEIWLNPYREALDGPAVLPLLRRATVPRLVLKEERPWFVADDEEQSPQLKADIAWPVNGSEAEHLWQTVCRDAETLAAPILQIVEQAFLDVHEMLAAFEPQRFDSWSYRRSAIEPHSQDEHRDAEDDLIDALRDSAVAQQASDASLQSRWLSSPYPLLRRLGIHLLVEDPARTADEKAHELLSSGLLFDHHLLHEVFRLVSHIAPDLGHSAREQLLDAMLVGPPPYDIHPETEALYHERGIFDLLEWTSRYVDDWPELTTELAAIRERRPDLGVREHPDFSHWMESGVWGGSAPMPVDEFIALAGAGGAASALRALLDRDFSERSFNEPTLRDACRVVTDAVAQRPDLGVGLLNELTPTVWLQQHELLAAVLYGWADGALVDDAASTAVMGVTGLLGRRDLARPLAQMCMSIVNRRTENRPPELLLRTDQLADSVWTQNALLYESGGWSDPFMAALNTWPGFIAQYWIHRIRVRWRMTDQWNGLDQVEKRALTAILNEPGPAKTPATAILFAELNFLFDADAAFTTSTVLPVFDPANMQAADAWGAYLYGGRVGPELLDAGLWTLLVEARNLFQTGANDENARRYWMTLAAVAADSPARVIDRDELISTLAAPPASVELVTFLQNIAVMISDDDPKQIVEVWRWLEPAWTRRIDAGPGTQSSDERAAWADLALEMRQHVPDAVRLAERAPGPFTGRTRYSRVDPATLQAHADLFANDARRRVELRGSADWHVDHELSELVAAIREHADPASMRALAEAASAAGIHSAPSWVA